MSDSLDIFAGAITKSSSSKDQPQAKQQNQQQGQPQQQSSQQGQAPQNAQQAQPSQPAQPQNGGAQGGKKRDKFRNRGGRNFNRNGKQNNSPIRGANGEESVNPLLNAPLPTDQ